MAKERSYTPGTNGPQESQNASGERGLLREPNSAPQSSVRCSVHNDGGSGVRVLKPPQRVAAIVAAIGDVAGPAAFAQKNSRVQAQRGSTTE